MKFIAALIILIATSFYGGLHARSSLDHYPLLLDPVSKLLASEKAWGYDLPISPHLRLQGWVQNRFVPEFRKSYYGNAFATDRGIITAAHCVCQDPTKGNPGWNAKDVVLISDDGRRWPVDGWTRHLDTDGEPCDVVTLHMKGNGPPCALLQMAEATDTILPWTPVRLRGYWGDSGFKDGRLMSTDGFTHARPVGKWFGKLFGGGTAIGVDFVANKGLSGSPLMCNGRVVALLSGGGKSGAWFTRIP